MIRLAIGYAALLAAIVYAADTGGLPRFVEHVHHLPYCDKIIHFALFGGLALVANLALVTRRGWSAARAIAIGSILVLMVATAEEYSNRFVTARDCSWGDLAANYLGVFCLGVLPVWSGLSSLSKAESESPVPQASAE